MPKPLVTRVAVRFAALYGAAYLFPFPFSAFTQAADLRLWRPLTDAIGAAIGGALGISVQTPTYTGDAMARYLFIAAAAVVSLALACLWAWLDRSRDREPRLDAWVRLYFRFALGYFLIDYGSVKVIPSQFSSPGLDVLYEPMGDASPMGLMWAFVGSSYAYGLFGGALEMAAGALLMFSRTALAGALLACGLMGHIVALNLGYDIPQKQLSIHLLVMAVYLLSPGLPALAAVLTGQAAQPVPRPALSSSGRLERAVSALGAAFFVYAAATTLANAAGNEGASGATAARSPLRGVWAVEEFVVNEGGTDTVIRPWRQVIFDGPERAGLKLEDGSFFRLTAAFNEAGTEVSFTREDGRNEETALGALAVERPGPGRRVLEGTWRGRPVRMRIVRTAERPFLLERRGFRWVSESEFIR